MIKRYIAFGVLLFITSVHPGFSGAEAAEDPMANSEVYTLGEVVVTEERDGVESIGTVVEITARDIEQKNARNLCEALELLPGLDVRTGAKGIPRINLRGFRSRHVLLLLNGIPFNSTYDGQFDPAIIPTENIAKIKVSYGVHSVLYGQGGLGGVINIITKKGPPGFKGHLSGELGERGDKLGRLSISGGSGRFDYFVSGSMLNSDGFRLSDDFANTSEEDGGLRENSDRKKENLFANIGVKMGDDWDLGLVIENLSGEFGRPPSVINDKDNVFAKRPRYERTEDYDGFSTQLSAGYGPDGPFGARAWIFYNELDKNLARYDDEGYEAITDKKSYQKDDKTSTQGGSLQASYDLAEAGNMTGSFSFQKDKYDSDGEYGNGNPIDDDKGLKTHSLALEYTVSLLSNFEVVMGYSHHWLNKDGGNDDDQGGFLFGAGYRISDKTHVRASVARKIRFPSIKQLYDVSDGNTDLTTEESMNYEVGLTRQLPWDMEAGIVGFLIDVEDYIEKDEITEIFENNEEYRFKGIEFTLEKRFLKSGSFQLGYTYMDSEDRSSGTRIDELEYRPEHKFTLQGWYIWNCGFSAYASFMYLTDQYHYSASDPILQRKLNSITLVDIKLQQKIITERLYAYVGANNLFDKDYEESYGFPQAGRQFYCGLKINF